MKIHNCHNNNTIFNTQNWVEYTDDVKIALEKQIAKKVNKFDGHYCRECKGKLARQTDLVNQKYCHHCGQKLDWNGTN